MQKTLIFMALLLIPLMPQATKVTLKKINGNYTLLTNGVPFFVKGTGGHHRPELIREYGGNAFRTWGHDETAKDLELAKKHGLMLAVGFWVQHERHGFDYNDKAKVKEQLERFRAAVREFKDHPNLLLWGIGNEYHLESKNPKVWQAVGDIARMCHEEDPNHPTMTVTAHILTNYVTPIKKYAPDIDIMGINTYAGIPVIPQHVRESGWNGPYLVTEWGVNGTWEVGKTSWGAYIEDTSSQKAKLYEDRYQNIILKDKERCLGSFVFVWGNKQEKTSTWFSMFLQSGEKIETVNVMKKNWSGNEVDNHAPRVTDLYLNGKKKTDNIKVKKKAKISCKIGAKDPEGDPIKYEWRVLPETTSTRGGGDHEDRIEEIKIAFKGQGTKQISFKAPKQSGPYRVYLFLYDGQGNAATANCPFYVE